MEKNTSNSVRARIEGFAQAIAAHKVKFCGVIMFETEDGKPFSSEVYNVGIVERLGVAELMRHSAEHEHRQALNQLAANHQLSELVTNKGLKQ